MADAKIHLVPFPTDRPKIPSNSIAMETLAVARECSQALQTYQAEIELRLESLAYLLNELELAAIRAIRKGK